MRLSNSVVCATFFSRVKGLMFSGKKTVILAFKKEQKISLHNWFVFFPLNLFFLDSNKRIIEIKKSFKPFAFYTSKKEAAYVVETPFEMKAELGEVVSFY